MGRAYADFEHRNMVLVSPKDKWYNDFAGVPVPSMQGLFDNPTSFINDFLKNLGQSVTSAGSASVLSDPSVQAALQAQLQNQVLQATAQQQLSFAQSIQKYKTYLLLGGAAAALVAVYFIAKKK